jgi:hypothetical protein
MKRKHKALLSILIVFLVAFSVYWFRPRRTAYSVAHVLTDLNISKEYKVEKFVDEWPFLNGNGESLIIFSIPKKDKANLIKSCIEKKFQKLPVKIPLPDNTIYNYLDKSDTLGFYKLNIDKIDTNSYRICIVSLNSKKIIIYNVIY